MEINLCYVLATILRVSDETDYWIDGGHAYNADRREERLTPGLAMGERGGFEKFTRN